MADAYDETAVQRALQRAMSMTDATEAGDVVNLSDFVLVHAEDAHALRQVALARRDKDGAGQMSLTLEALNSKFASYGPQTERVRISRSAYDAMGRPARLDVRIDPGS